VFQATLGMINGIADIDPEHDLAFDVYLDPETGAMIRQLVRLKKECVADENYEKAHELKAVIDGLLQAGAATQKNIKNGPFLAHFSTSLACTAPYAQHDLRGLMPMLVGC